ncbi:hypothetical protein VN12_02495 [Pirellula sp. SH-Sr6A]|nr:hypothetical protein VN12_02495 [Pirellula sp. SH-Sr6A]
MQNAWKQDYGLVSLPLEPAFLSILTNTVQIGLGFATWHSVLSRGNSAACLERSPFRTRYTQRMLARTWSDEYQQNS